MVKVFKFYCIDVFNGIIFFFFILMKFDCYYRTGIRHLGVRWGQLYYGRWVVGFGGVVFGRVLGYYYYRY